MELCHPSTRRQETELISLFIYTSLPEMRQLNQRITRRCTTRPLTRDEVEQYVGFRVRMAGGAGETMFTGRALDLIY